MLLGDIMNHHEFVNVEYKEFCIKTNLYEEYTHKEMKEFITSSLWLTDFNELIIKNIKRYIYMYVPKYMSAFHNCNEKNSDYHLFIGINDHSEITGIPFKGNLRMYTMYFKTCIDKAIKKCIPNRCCMSCDFTILKNGIDVDILNDNINEVLLINETKQKQYKDAYAVYTEAKKKWINDILIYKGCLENLINNVTIKLDFVKFLESKNLLTSFPEVFKKKHVIPSKHVKNIKNNPTNLVHWLIKFKDEKVTLLQTQKPIEPILPKCINVYNSLLTQLSPLRKRLVDKGASYYTIMVTFVCSDNCSEEVWYKDKRTNDCRALKRVIGQSGTPECIDIK